MPHEPRVTVYAEPGLYVYLRPRWSSAVAVELVGGTGGASSDGRPGQPGQRRVEMFTGEELRGTFRIAVSPGGGSVIVTAIELVTEVTGGAGGVSSA